MQQRNGFRTVVCVKQVPVAAAVEFDAATGRLERAGIPSEVNSDDVRALLAAIEIRRWRAGEVVVLTMGPPEASRALTYCLALGADRAVHLCDPAFAGADTLATARTLGRAIEREAPDLVLCGRSSTDAETGNVGPQLAELLGLPQLTGVCAMDIDQRSGRLVALRDTDDGFERVRTALPALLVVGEDVAAERFPSREEKAAAARRPIQRLGLADLGGDAAEFGAAGSPTAVTEVVHQPAARRAGVVRDDQNPDTQVTTILDWLARWVPAGSVERADTRPPAHPVRRHDTGICVYVETGTNGVRPVSLELLAMAAELADQVPAQVDALLVGANVRHHAEEVAAYGADRVLLAEDRRLADYDTGTYTAAVVQALGSMAPSFVLFPSTAHGRDLAPRCAARMRVGLTADCVGMHLDDGRLLQHKPAFGDDLVAMITTSTSPALLTIRPGVAKPLVPRWHRRVPVNHVRLPGLPERSATVLDRSPAADGAGLTTTDIVIGVGTGAVSRLAEIHELAGLLGASVGCTRKVADTAALPRRTQIGLTGCAIAPHIYIAIGVRGAYEHVVGVRRAQHVLAIDIDEDSMMFDHSDLGVVGDCAVLVPRLLERLSEQRPDWLADREDQCTPA